MTQTTPNAAPQSPDDTPRSGLSQQLLRYAAFALLALAVVALAQNALRGDPDAAREAWTLIEDGALVIDVRSPEEFAAGHLEGALHIPWDQTDALAEAIGEDRSRSVVMYCGSGKRVGRAIDALEARGYDALFNATGLDALEATRPQ
jgi:phage shock protein E